MSGLGVIERLARRLFGSPILRNDLRGEVVEEIIALALEPQWTLCSGDWAAYDLIHPTSGLRVQVKQSAARQTWHKGECPPPKPRFSIAEKTGRLEAGDQWIAQRSRNADIFVFAWHPLTGDDADHRQPDQWLFYIVPEMTLPQQSSVSLAGVTRLASPVNVGGLAVEMARAADELLDQSEKRVP
jgi:hypothetical protein